MEQEREEYKKKKGRNTIRHRRDRAGTRKSVSAIFFEKENVNVTVKLVQLKLLQRLLYIIYI